MSNFSLGGNNDVVIKVDGLDELTTSFLNLIKKYPDRAGELLQKEGKSLRKDVVNKINQHLNTNDIKMSLGKVSNYTVTAPKGIGINQYVEVIAKSPHFHLIENGHDLVTPKTRTIKLKDGSRKKITIKNGGQSKGFVVGYKFMDESARACQANMPDTVERMVNILLNEEGLV